MTKNIAEPRPRLPLRARSAASQPSEYSTSLDTTQTSYVHRSACSAPSRVVDQAGAPHLMYRFGSDMGDPAEYSQSSPLRPALHFVAPEQVQDESAVSVDLWSAYVIEEFANSGVYEDFPDSFTNPYLVAATQELEAQSLHTLPRNYTPAWPWQQSVYPPGPFHTVKEAHGHSPQNPSYSFGGVSPCEPHGNAYSSSASGTLMGPQRRPLLPKDQRMLHAPPDAPDSDDGYKAGGRKRALSPDARAAAQRIRIMGACARCHEKKEKCNEERPCNPCLGKNKRSLDFPCSSELPGVRHVHLFTEEMYGHLELKQGEFFKKLPRPDPDFQDKPFMLRLHQYFDDPELLIPVIRFRPRSLVDTSKSIFPIVSEGKGLEVRPMDILSPPLVPAMNNDNIIRFTERFRHSVKRWLECAESHEDIEWHRTFFREEYGKPWPRDVFSDACKFFHQVTMAGCPALKSSLQSTVLVYMLGHSFYVPEEDLGEVMERTGMGKYDGNFRFVSPIHIDRFLKTLLFQFFRATVKLAFKHYQDLASPNKHSKLSRDRILATSIVLLIVAGSQQSKAVEKAVAKHRRGQDVDEEAVYTQIKEIEDWINDMIIENWRYKFSKTVKWIDDESRDRHKAYQAKRFDLLGRFQKSFETYGKELEALSIDLPPDISIKTFGTTNIDRLLKKFYMTVFPPETPGQPMSRGSISLPDSRTGFVIHREQPFNSSTRTKREPEA